MIVNHRVPLPQENRILGALPEAELDRILPQLETIAMGIKQTLYEIDKPIRDVYFPLSGVTSVLASTGGKGLVEVATIGREGMVGLPVFLGSLTSQTLCFSQIPGYAARMSTEAFQDAVQKSPALFRLLQSFTQALFDLIAQTAACNRHHETAQRLARWLLMSQDRVGSDQFQLTQEFIADMLGVRRATANEAEQALHERGLIQYRRGIVTVLDRQGLEAASCVCYRIITENFEKLIPHNPTFEKNPPQHWGIGGGSSE